MISLDGIFGLLAVLFFVIIPLISSISKEAKKKAADEAARQAPARPAPATQQGAGRPAAGSSDAELLRQRLEEARKRIEASLGPSGGQRTSTSTAAQPTLVTPGQVQASTAAAPAGGTSGAPTGPVIFSGGSVAGSRTPGTVGGAPSQGWQQTGIDWQQAAIHEEAESQRRARELQEQRRKREQAARRPEGLAQHAAALEVGEDLQITRLPRPNAYTDRRSGSDFKLGFSRDAVLNGMIWHQILSEPPHARRNGRKTSRLRSR